MGPLKISDGFYLYLWRSPSLPGTLYLAKGFQQAEALCRGLTEDGYIVKVIQIGTDIEFELRAGKLCPAGEGSAPDGQSGDGPSSAGMTEAFA
jgi:hypothetical protein